VNVVIFTISYGNDKKMIAEWLDAFYANLSYHKDVFDKLDHYILLNEEDVEKAEENIKKISSRYNIPNYNNFFKVSDFSQNEESGTGTHHAKAFRKHITDLKSHYDLKKFDLFFVQEFDVLFERGLLDFIKKIKFVIDSFDNCLVGNIYPNDFETSDQPQKSQKSLKNFLDDNSHKIENFKIYFSRILPHFLAFNHETYNKVLELKEYFRRDDVVSELRGIYRNNKSKKNNFNIDFVGDTGTDFYKRWLRNNSFFHIKTSNEPLNHIKGLSAVFNRYLKKENLKYLNILKNKFSYLKNNFDFLNFHESSIFKRDFDSFYEEYLD